MPTQQTLASAMAAAFGAIDAATKAAAGQVGQQKYKYADLTSVIDAIKPALVANGLFFTQHPRPNEKGVEVETILHHASGEVISLGSLFVPADRSNAQAFGSALTYARRYGLVTAFGVPVEDDDGSAATKPSPAAKPETISDADRDIIAGLAEATGTDLKTICDAYRVQSLKDLTVQQGMAAIKRLQAKPQVKEAA
ncbi:MAG: single-stranded DNA-binding protein [Marinobacter sp.]|nr:single-stranded DNA-binding protein [Marinobacter sp.]|tara:strand:- start:2781 stop:3368 length:588 start_codon:yes stop_codon:yes gene_type:complete